MLYLNVNPDRVFFLKGLTIMEERRDHKIYKYTNKVNGKVYIGRTCQTLVGRAGRNGIKYKGCHHFWRAIQKYGWSNFEPIILEEGLSNGEAAKREIFYIKEYDSTNKENGYNLVDTDARTCSDSTRERLSEMGRGIPSPMGGKLLSHEIKEKISNTLKGKNKGIESPSNRGIICVETGIEYYSLMNAQECTGIKYGNISRALNGTLKGKDSTAGGYHWKYKSVPEKWKYKRSVLCVETGIEYESAAEASRCTGVYRKSIEDSARNNGNSNAGGYHWIYTDKNIAKEKEGVHVFCYETKEEFCSFVMAGRSIGATGFQIREAVLRKIKAGGYHWVLSLEDKLDMRPKKGEKRKVLCVETGVIYNSMREAKDAIGMLRASSISNAVKSGGKAYGYHWRYVDE